MVEWNIETSAMTTWGGDTTLRTSHHGQLHKSRAYTGKVWEARVSARFCENDRGAGQGNRREHRGAVAKDRRRAYHERRPLGNHDESAEGNQKERVKSYEKDLHLFFYLLQNPNWVIVNWLFLYLWNISVISLLESFPGKWMQLDYASYHRKP